MAYSLTEYTGDGIQSSYSAVFPVIDTNDIKVTLDGNELVEGVDYNVSGFTDAGDVATIDFIVTPTNLSVLTIQRFTDISKIEAIFKNRAIRVSADMDRVNLQILYSVQESDDRINNYINKLGGNNVMNQDLDMNLFRIIQLGTAVADNDAVSLKQATDLFSSIVGNDPIENPFFGEGYQIGQTAYAATDLTSLVDFEFVSRAITAQYLISNYPDFNEATALTPGGNTVYDIGGGFFELPALTSSDVYQNYYTRLK